MKEFTGRVVAPGTVTAPALVSQVGLNTLASFQKALQFGDKKATCGTVWSIVVVLLIHATAFSA